MNEPRFPQPELWYQKDNTNLMRRLFCREERETINYVQYEKPFFPDTYKPEWYSPEKY